jgi:pimeloyl-ACP methyl ester carboxylesterase
VAIAPFSDMRSEVSHYVRTIGIPGVGPFLSEEYIQAAVDEAGRINGFSPDRADAAIAIQYTDAPVLLVHGKADMIIPCSHSERLHAAAQNHSELLLMPGLGHVTVWVDPLGKVRRASEAWFDSHLVQP